MPVNQGFALAAVVFVLVYAGFIGWVVLRPSLRFRWMWPRRMYQLVVWSAARRSGISEAFTSGFLQGVHEGRKQIEADRDELIQRAYCAGWEAHRAHLTGQSRLQTMPTSGRVQ